MIQSSAVQTHRRMKMKTQFIQVETMQEAKDAAPWAAEIVEVDGGFMTFESIADFETWNNQQ